MELNSRLLIEDNLLLISVHEPVTTEHRADLARAIDQLLAEHHPCGLVIELGPASGTAAAISVILRHYRHSTAAGVPLAVATAPAAVRYLIKANQPSLPVHADTDTAVRTVRALLHRQAPNGPAWAPRSLTVRAPGPTDEDLVRRASPAV